MVLLNDIVMIFIGANAHIPSLHALTPQLPKCRSTRHVAIEGGDGTREALAVRVERLANEGLGCSDSAIATQQEVDRLRVLLDRSR